MQRLLNERISDYWPFHEHRPARIVVKVGSNVLAVETGGLRRDRIKALCDSIARAHKAGTEVILVSSGAVAAGRGLIDLEKRPTTIPELQAVAAIGQGALIEEYNTHLRPHGLFGAQMLLNRDDMDDRRRYLNARVALYSLLRHKAAIPIINENDSVNIDELKFGDNDILSAIIAAKMDADLLVIMSNVPGLMTGNPARDPEARVIPVVKDFRREWRDLVHSEMSNHGTGGMGTKLEAARHATYYGVSSVITDGMKDEQLDRVLSGDFEGTFFLARGSRRAGSAKKHWLGTHRPKGGIVVDDGARKAVHDARRSLLPVGIHSVTGKFRKGDVVRIEDASGDTFAHGITNYDSATLDQIKGKHGDEITEMLGEAGYMEAIHADNLAIFRE